MQNEVRAVLIVHEMKDTKTYINFSQFFQMIGIFAEECRSMNSQLVNKLYNDFDMYLFIDENKTGSIRELLEFECNQSARLVTINLQDSEDDTEELSKLLKLLKEEKIIEEKTYRIWWKLAKIYIQEKICYHDYNTEYYFYDKRIVKEAYMAFSKVNDSLYKYLSESQNLQINTKKYILLARGYCIRRTHQLAEVINCRKIYATEMILDEIEKILEVDETFSYAYLLMGYLAATDDMLKYKANKYYERCLQGIEKKSYSSKIWYRLGNFYEKIKKDWSKAIIYYSKAIATNQDNFRALYKEGYYINNLVDSQNKEIKIFQEIEEYLNQFVDNNYLQPLELEYLFKVDYLCAEIFSRNNQTLKEAYIYYEKIEKIVKNPYEENKFFISFYKEEAEDFFHRSIVRLPTHRVSLKKEQMRFLQERMEIMG